MADLRHEAVVGLDREAPDAAAEPLPESRDRGHRRRRGAGGRREERQPSLEEVRIRRLDARALGARHGMSADEADAGARRAPERRLHHAPLDAPRVGEDGAGREVRPRRADEARQGPDGRTEHDQRRSGHARGEIRRAGIRSPHVDGGPDRRGVPRDHHHLAGEPPRPHSPRDGPTDQARAHHRQPRPTRRAHPRAPFWASTVRRDSTSRVFSSGVPTVIRSPRSRPKLARGRTITPSLRSFS